MPRTRPSIRAVVLIVASLVLVSPASQSQSQSQARPPWPASTTDYRSTLVLNTELRDLAARFPDFARVVTIGVSRGGEEIVAVEVGVRSRHTGTTPPKDAPGPQRRFWGATPALLVVASVEDDGLAGTRSVVTMIEHLLQAKPTARDEILGGRHLYFVPRANPDGAARWLNGGAGHAIGNTRRYDADRDGRLDEDPPNDLDGDGIILQLRVRDDEKGTLVEDVEHVDRLRPADAKKGEIGVFRLLSEGRDDDGDGDHDEDGHDGVDIARNFPHAHHEHDFASGPYATSEPATRALVDYVLARRNIEAAVVIGAHDSVAELPAADKKPSAGGRRRRPQTKLQTDDVEIWKAVAEAWKKTAVPSRERRKPSGALHEWLYFHVGVPAFAVAPFEADVAPKKSSDKKKSKDDDTADAVTDAADVSTEKTDGSMSTSDKTSDETEQDPFATWAAWVRRDGFVDWRRLRHPQLGDIEIGGWRPGVRTIPPVSLAEYAATKMLPFLGDVIGRFASIETDMSTKRLANGLTEIKLNVRNRGRWPTAIRQGLANREASPTIIELAVAKEAVVHGRRRHLVDRLDGIVGRRAFRWVVLGEPGSKLELTVASPRIHPTILEVTLP